MTTEAQMRDQFLAASGLEQELFLRGILLGWFPAYSGEMHRDALRHIAPFIRDAALSALPRMTEEELRDLVQQALHRDGDITGAIIAKLPHIVKEA